MIQPITSTLSVVYGPVACGLGFVVSARFLDGLYRDQNVHRGFITHCPQPLCSRGLCSRSCCSHCIHGGYMYIYTYIDMVCVCIYSVHRKFINGAQTVSIGFTKGSRFCRRFM